MFALQRATAPPASGSVTLSERHGELLHSQQAAQHPGRPGRTGPGAGAEEKAQGLSVHRVVDPARRHDGLRELSTDGEIPKPPQVPHALAPPPALGCHMRPLLSPSL